MTSVLSPGALCTECNMKIDPPRPEVDVFFHKLTGLTFYRTTVRMVNFNFRL